MLVKRIAAIALIICVVLPAASARADTDEYIFTDPVSFYYDGRTEGPDLIDNLNFGDLQPSYWAKDAVVRGGALNLIKAYGPDFNPNATVSNVEALAFILRAMNMETAAHDAAVTLQPNYAADTPLTTLWELGYVSQAFTAGLITQAQSTDGLTLDQTAMDPAVNFVRNTPVTREQVADWILRGLRIVNPAAFTFNRTQQSIYRFSDWQSIAPNMVNAVELVAEANIMTGSGDGNRFRPKDPVTRAEIAQILKNTDSVYYPLIGVVKKTGTVGGIRDVQDTSTATALVTRQIYVRTADGAVDVLRFTMARSSSPQDGISDAVTLRDGIVGSLTDLREGDEVEYLVRSADYVIMYVEVTNPIMDVTKVSGRLETVDTTTRIITIKDAHGKTFDYTMAESLVGTDDGTPYIRFEKQKRDPTQLPFGSGVELTLKNNIVDEIRYLGERNELPLAPAVVLENNPDMGYIVLYTPDREAITEYYTPQTVSVERLAYYDSDDERGYMDTVFPDFAYDPADTTIKSVEPGDIVTYRTDDRVPSVLTQIYARTDYWARYGQVKEFRRHGRTADMLIEYEDKQNAWYVVPDEAFVTKGGRKVGQETIQNGDWARVLVNSVAVEPGHVLEAVKEITLEGAARYVSKIVTGQLAGIDRLQNQLLLQNSRTLSKTGWTDDHQIEQFELAGNGEVEYYYGNVRISPETALARLKRGGQVYMAIEDGYAGERVRKVTYYENRDEPLNADVVLGADGSGSFYIAGNGGTIKAGAGTIVRRFGRLTGAKDIEPFDYAAVNLNGEDSAAVVDITRRPDASGVVVSRGRVLSIDEGRSFQVESMSTLYGIQWNYTPVERRFVIDPQTLFVTADGITPNYTFLGYTDASAIGKVYNVVVDGSKAARVIEAPYAPKAVRGTVYQTGGGSVMVNDCATYDNTTGKWRLISNTDATASITLPPNAIIIGENKLIDAGGLQRGDHLRVMTDSLPAVLAGGMSVTGYIVSVEQ